MRPKKHTPPEPPTHKELEEELLFDTPVLLEEQASAAPGIGESFDFLDASDADVMTVRFDKPQKAQEHTGNARSALYAQMAQQSFVPHHSLGYTMLPPQPRQESLKPLIAAILFLMSNIFLGLLLWGRLLLP